jgi:hypothetical protein
MMAPFLSPAKSTQHTSRGSLCMLRGDYPLVGSLCPIVLALPIEGGTQVECCPRFSLSGSRLICMVPYLTLRLAGGLSSGQFFSPLTRFGPSVLNVVIVLIDAFLLWRRRISQIC